MLKWFDRLENRRLLRFLLLFALGWIGVQLLKFFATVVLIFLLSAILAFLLNYPVRWVERYLPHTAAVTLVFLGALAIVIGVGLTLGFGIIGQLQELLSTLPDQVDTWINLLNDIQRWLERWNLEIDFRQIESELRNYAFAGLEFGFGKLQFVFSLLLESIIVAVITFFMLLDGQRLWQYLLSFLPEPWQERVPRDLQRNFLGFFWGRFLLSLFFGVSVFIILLLLRAPYALALAAIAGAFDLIPGIGATLGIAIVSLILLPKGLALSFKVLVGCILLQQVEENILMPRIMRNSVNLNPVILFLALLVGATLAGFVGVFLAIPITGTLVSLFKLEALQAGHQTLRPKTAADQPPAN